MSAVDYRFDDYEDFEASALARLAIDDDDADDEDGADGVRDETAALNCSRLEAYDPAFEEMYNLTTPTEEDCPPVVVEKPHKTTSRRTRGLLRRINRRSNISTSERSNGDASSSVASGRSRRSLRSIRSTQSCKTLRTSTTLASADALATTSPQRGVGRSQSYNVRNSSPTTSGKKRGVLHKLHFGPRRGHSCKSSNTKETFPEEQSIDEARCPSTTTDDDSSNVLRQQDYGDDDSDSDSSVYYDDFSSSSDNNNNDEAEATESSMGLDQAVTHGPPVFLIETGEQASFHTSGLHVSLADLTNVSVPEEEEEDEEEKH